MADRRERRETDPLAATALGEAEATPALDATQISDEHQVPVVGLQAGDRVGRFEILHLLGAGGMGAVYAARDTELQRKVAIKVLRRARPGTEGRAMSARLLREAQAAARLSHRNVVTIYEVGTIGDGQVFVAMELVEGGTLSTWYDRRPSWREAVRVYLQAARGLAAAHAAGLVHRDFKPDNALLGDDGEVKVSDFGLASVAGERATPTAPAAISLTQTRLTSTGEVMGTPLYMAPEQRDGGTIDARADQYAFCVALFRAAYRRFPFGFDDEASIAARARAHEVDTASRGAPRALYRILRRGLAPDPAARFPDLPTLILALERVTGARRRLAIAGVIGGATLAVATLALLAGRRSAAVEPCTGAAAELAAIWNPEVAGRLQSIMAASGLPGIDQTWSRATAELHGWSDRWVIARTAACRATRVDRSQSEEQLDRRTACLDQQALLLRASLTMLEGGDRETLSRAAEIASRLPRVDECVNAASFGTGTDEIRTALRELQVADMAGRFRDQLARAQQVLADAKALGDRALEAEAGLQLGRFQRMAALNKDAQFTLLEAATTAEVATTFEIAARAWAEWIYVAATGDVTDGQIVAIYPQAEETLRRAGSDPLLTSILRNNQGVAAYQAGRDDEAEKLYREALSLREASLGPDHWRVAEVLDNLGNLLAARANDAPDAETEARYRDAALVEGQRGLAIREKSLGVAHPAVARSLHNVGATLVDLGRLDEAEDHLRRALALKQEVLGPEHPDLGTTYFELGGLEERRGNLEAAVEDTARTIELWRKDGVRSILPSLTRNAQQLVALGRFEEAITAYEEAVALSKNPVKAASYRRWADEARIELGQVDVALADLQSIVAIEAEAYSLGDLKRAPALLSLAWAEIASGRPKDGLHSLDRTEALFLTNPDNYGTTNRSLIAIARAEAQLQLGKKAKAIELATEAARCTFEECRLDMYVIRRRAAKLGAPVP